MTLLLQTENHVKARKARRAAARLQQLQAALDAAIAETEAEIHAGAFRVPEAGTAAAATGPIPGFSGGPAVGAEAAAAFASATAAAADAAGLSEEEHIRFSNEIYVPTQSISDALMGQIRDRSKLEARHALSALAAKLRRAARRDAADDDLHRDSTLEELRKLVPVEFLVAWAAWTTASDLVGQSRVTDGVRWAVWGLYSLAAFFYVLWQLHESRKEELCEDCPGEEGSEDEHDLLEVGDGTSHVGVSPAPLEGRRTVESNGFHGSDDASAVSLFQFIYEENWHRAPLLGPERSDAASRDSHSTHGGHSTHSVRGALSGHGAAPRRGSRASPSDAWLAVQAAVSAVAFMLLSAATADVYLKPRLMLWGVLALVPLFPLFAQFVLPNGVRRRRRRR